MNTSAQQNDSSDTTQKFLNDAARSAAVNARYAGNHFVAEPAQDLLGVLTNYAKRKPEVAAMWCFGLGVLVGWRLRG